MGGNVQLLQPSEMLREAYMDFYREWLDSGEKLIPSVISMDPTDYPAMLKRLQNQSDGIGLREDQVPASTYWLVRDEGRVLGAVNIRHRLNRYLTNIGGHIGYGLRPSERRKGYAPLMLALALERAKALGIDKALVTCDSGNTPSERTILANGGVPDTPYTEDEGIITKRFWISIG